jgi:hypothetical protein
VGAELVAAPINLQICVQDLVLRTVRTTIARADASGGEVPNAGFELAISEQLADLIPIDTILSVRTPNGAILRMASNAAAAPIGRAVDGGRALRERLERGYTVDKWGYLTLPFGAAPQRRPAYLDSMSAAIDLMSGRYGILLFPHYGTLLGLEREGRLLASDDDIDLSYIARARTLDHVAEEFFGLVDDLVAGGHRVELVSTGHFQLRVAGRAGPPVDVFTSWIDADGCFHTYFGVRGHLKMPLTFTQRELEGRRVTVPEDSKALLALTYGPGWQVPDPHFQWQPAADIKQTMERLAGIGAERCEARKLRWKLDGTSPGWDQAEMWGAQAVKAA